MDRDILESFADFKEGRTYGPFETCNESVLDRQSASSHKGSVFVCRHPVRTIEGMPETVNVPLSTWTCLSALASSASTIVAAAGAQ